MVSDRGAVALVILAVAVMIVVTFAQAADAEPRKVFTPETTPTSCGAWTEARQTKSVRAELLKEWVAGFLSGMNLKSDEPDALLGTDFEGATAWLDNYCKANPLATITEASMYLLKQLTTNAAKR
jgi:hypothetical protein